MKDHTLVAPAPTTNHLRCLIFYMKCPWHTSFWEKSVVQGHHATQPLVNVKFFLVYLMEAILQRERESIQHHNQLADGSGHTLAKNVPTKSCRSTSNETWGSFWSMSQRRCQEGHHTSVFSPFQHNQQPFWLCWLLIVFILVLQLKNNTDPWTEIWITHASLNFRPTNPCNVTI